MVALLSLTTSNMYLIEVILHGLNYYSNKKTLKLHNYCTTTVCSLSHLCIVFEADKLHALLPSTDLECMNY